MATKTFDTALAVVGKVSQTGTPTDPTDLVTKAYADALGGGSGAPEGEKISEMVVATAADIVAADKVPFLNVDDPSNLTGEVQAATVAEWIKRLGPVMNTSTAQQTSFASDAYLLGSEVTIPPGRLQIKSVYNCRFNVVKTAAGTTAPVINVRFGTAASTADTSRATLTFPVQTGVADEGIFDVSLIFRVVGASAVVQALAWLNHRLSTTGLSNVPGPTVIATSAAFDVTPADTKIGLSVNAGASAAWTVNSVITRLENLT